MREDLLCFVDGTGPIPRWVVFIEVERNFPAIHDEKLVCWVVYGREGIQISVRSVAIAGLGAKRDHELTDVRVGDEDGLIWHTLVVEGESVIVQSIWPAVDGT